ncbi:MAG: retroviral-like aspartic protease [Verrucomicrobia bacterium]|nr:retroviral-like aspartic protease [Verrucomicrobiota bacterium]
MPAYDAIRFAPPAPVALVTLRNAASAASVSDVPMLLDSGADVTLLPRLAVERLGLSLDPEAVYELLSFDGRRSSAQAVHADLVFLSRTFRGRFLLTDQACGILGRDILNHLALLLDGPNASWQEPRVAGD